MRKDENILSFDAITIYSIENNMETSKSNLLEYGNYNISYYFESGENNLKVFMKRIIRINLKFLPIPIIEKQNNFNKSIMEAENSYLEKIEEHDHLLENLNYEITQLTKHIENLNLK